MEETGKSEICKKWLEKIPYSPNISASEFDEAQSNRTERSNVVITEDGKKRKPVRYKSV